MFIDHLVSHVVNHVVKLLRGLIGAPRLPRLVVAERGQSTAEYALVLLGVGAIAMLVMAWATKTNRIGALLDAVFKSLTGLVG